MIDVKKKKIIYNMQNVKCLVLIVWKYFAYVFELPTLIGHETHEVVFGLFWFSQQPLALSLSSVL